MRNLTIKREKSFVGCFTKARVFVCDELTGDTKINGDKCYKIGDLKNGEEKTFAIGDEETKIYVAQDKLSRKLTNEVCFIPAGVEDVYLMGEFKYNPFGGNAFRFHGMTDPRVLANRKKSSKKFGVFFALCLIFGVILGSWSGYESPNNAIDGEPCEIVHDSGIKMTLTDSFIETNIASYDFAYGCDDVAVFGVEEKFDLVEGFGDYSLKEYGELVIKNTELDSKLQKEDGLMFFEYEFYNEQDAINYSYLVAVYKTTDSFWCVSYAVSDDQYEMYKPMFLEWAKSVQFVEE